MNPSAVGVRGALSRFLSRAASVIARPTLVRTLGTGLNRPFVRDLLMLRDDIGFFPLSIVDAGASVGAWTRAAMFVYPESRISAFEPVSDSFAALSTLQSSHPRLVCFPLALGAANTSSILHRNAFADASSLLAMTPLLGQVYPHAQNASPVAVEQRRLDSIQNQQIAAPALLKLDVQGAELQVLEGCGMLLKFFGVIITEINFTSIYDGQAGYDQLFAAMRSLGFTRFIQLRPNEVGSSGIHSCDVMFLRDGIGEEGVAGGPG
jgi:FkbM family methyltransferase